MTRKETTMTDLQQIEFATFGDTTPTTTRARRVRRATTTTATTTDTPDAPLDDVSKDVGPRTPGELSVVNGDAARFIVGGRAIFTIESLRTGTRYTFQVKKTTFDDKPDRPFYFVALLTGPDNTADYTYVGTLDPSALTLKLTGKSRLRDDAPAVVALRASLAFIAARRAAPSLRVFHEGRCCVCSRRLTVPESIINGIGPVCAEGL